MVSEKYRPSFVDTLVKELEMRKDYLQGQKVSTIYLGGGTPSLLSYDELNKILEAAGQHLNIDSKVEITLEANPDDIDDQWIINLKRTAVNRLSIGVQSFHDDDLQYLHRRHGGLEAIDAIKRAQDGGFTNITADLIYGIPGLSNNKWEENLETFFNLKIPHLSAYALTVEENTPLSISIRKRKISAPDENHIIEHFKSLVHLTKAHNYIHYEISNFALEGYHSRHNSIYWTGGHYLGLGPSAHSYNGHSRRWNKSSLKIWSKLEDFYDEVFEEEILSMDQRYNEYVMTSLRTQWGCDLSLVKEEFGNEYHEHLLHESAVFIHEEKMVNNSNRLYLTEKGKLFADGIASELFI